MAAGIKYKFTYESVNGAEYTVNIITDGASGAAISRPLGKAPVLHKSTNGCIHSTSLDLVLECRVDGEYAEFYNASPGDYLVALLKNNTQIWQGSLVTELYSAPEIAPPYDVRITANDGIALTKEFLYEPQGAITPKALVRNLLADVPNLGRSIYIISGIGATGIDQAGFWNTALINLDYKAGETKYDVLTYFLETIHATITMHDGNWLIVRETDATVSGSSIPCLLAPSRSDSISSTSISGAVLSAGKMGVATLWPIGHMTTNISPAKRRVTVEAPYHLASGAPSVAANGWTIADSDHASFTGSTYLFTYATIDDEYGDVYAHIPIRSFTRDLRLSIKVSTDKAYVYTNYDLKIYVTFTPTGGSTLFYNGIAWVSSQDVFENPDLPKPVGLVENPEDYSFVISPNSSFADGTLEVNFVGRRVRLYDAVLETVFNTGGHKDTISINNGARGDGDTVEIAGARVTSDDVVSSAFLQGVFLNPDSSPVENFYDSSFSGGLSFMSLIAMGNALSVALPRLELSGNFNFPSNVTTVPLVVTYGGVKYWIESFDLNAFDDEISLTARALPSASLSVESETITELPTEQSSGGSSSGGSGGGGGGGGSYTLPVASASTLGGVKVGSGLSIDSSTGVLSATGVGGGTVTSVGMTVPTGMTIHGTPITGAGTLALGLATGKTIPDSADVDKGVTAYGWGNHANAGYATTSALGDYVTLATTQNNISGEKTFITNPVHIGSTSGLKVDGSSYIDIGDVRLAYDSTAECLHVTNRAGTNKTIGMYADGTVAAGGVGAQASFLKCVQCTQSEYNAISPKDITTLYIINDGARVYLGSILLFSEA